MRRLITFLIVLVVLAVVVDRVAVVLASHVVADQIADHEPDCTKPGVDIKGFPFLTQAIRGRYSDVAITTTCHSPSADLQFDPVKVDLHGVHVSLSQAVHNQINQVPIDSVDGTATVPFAGINSQLASRHIQVGPGSGHTITVTGSVSAAGQTITAHGSGQVTITNDDLVVSVSDVTAGGGTVPGQALDFSLPIPPLPFQLTQVSISSSPDGVAISGHAVNVVLSR